MIFGVFHTLMTHNHEFATPEERCNLRSGRKVLLAHGNIISIMVSSSIKATKSYILSKELGGANNVGFLFFFPLILFSLFCRALQKILDEKLFWIVFWTLYCTANGQHFWIAFSTLLHSARTS